MIRTLALILLLSPALAVAQKNHASTAYRLGPSASLPTCSSAQKGLRFSGSDNKPYKCDGSSWAQVGGTEAVASESAAGAAGDSTGKIIFDSGAEVLKYSNGSQWRQITDGTWAPLVAKPAKLRHHFGGWQSRLALEQLNVSWVVGFRNATGTQANVADSTTRTFYKQIATTATINTGAKIQEASNQALPGTWSNPRIWVRLNPVDTSDVRYTAAWAVNFVENPMIYDGSTAEAAIWFRYSTSAPDTNWQCCSNDGTTEGACTDSGVPFVAGQWVTLGWETTDHGASIDYYINGANVCTHSTELPSTTSALWTVISVYNLGAAVKTLRINSIGGSYELGAE